MLVYNGNKYALWIGKNLASNSITLYTRCKKYELYSPNSKVWSEAEKVDALGFKLKESRFDSYHSCMCRYVCIGSDLKQIHCVILNCTDERNLAISTPLV